MEYSPEEKKALEMLNMENFKNPKKENLVNFVSNLSTMDREVAMAAINRMPELTTMIKEMAENYKSFLINNNSNNMESTKSVLDSYDTIINACKSKINNASSRESDEFYIEKMFEAAGKKSEKDSENKKFLFSREQLYGLGLVFTAGLVLSFLSGGKISINGFNGKI